MNSETNRWLQSSEAAQLVDDLTGQSVSPAIVAALRKQVGDSAEKASAALELAELRCRATTKFTQAARMYFTRKAYQQATDEWIARYKAKRFAGSGRVVDACCGIGGDLIGLSGAVTESVGIDVDPVMTAYAQRNVAAYDLETLVESYELSIDTLPDCDAWHADPDRRPAGKRTTQPDQHLPSLETLVAWRVQVPAAAVKFAPAARLPADWNAEAELEWISRGGEGRQLVAWCGPLAIDPGRRRATIVEQSGKVFSVVGDASRPVPAASTLGDWIHEPDAAVLAADLTGTLAQQHGLHAVTPPLPYLTSNSPVDDRLIASFQVIDAMPFHRKRLAAWLADRSIGRVEIKCRGVDVRPETLRRELKPKGDREATLVVFANTSGKMHVVIAKRHPTSNLE